MKFDTDKFKIRKLFETGKVLQNLITDIKADAVQEQRVVELSAPRVLNFNNTYIQESSWQLLTPQGVQEDGSYNYKSIELRTSLNIPTRLIPFVRYEVLTQNLVDPLISPVINRFCIVEDFNTNLKSVTWVCSYFETRQDQNWNDIQFKLALAVINPYSVRT